MKSVLNLFSLVLVGCIYLASNAYGSAKATASNRIVSLTTEECVQGEDFLGVTNECGFKGGGGGGNYSSYSSGQYTSTPNEIDVEFYCPGKQLVSSPVEINFTDPDLTPSIQVGSDIQEIEPVRFSAVRYCADVVPDARITRRSLEPNASTTEIPAGFVCCETRISLENLIPFGESLKANIEFTASAEAAGLQVQAVAMSAQAKGISIEPAQLDDEPANFSIDVRYALGVLIGSNIGGLEDDGTRDIALSGIQKGSQQNLASPQASLENGACGSLSTSNHSSLILLFVLGIAIIFLRRIRRA